MKEISVALTSIDLLLHVIIGVRINYQSTIVNTTAAATRSSMDSEMVSRPP